MKVGAWFHNHDEVSLDGQFALAAEAGIVSARAYDVDYARLIAPLLRRHKMSLLAGLDVDADALLADWRTQVCYEKLATYLALHVDVAGICVGNELREGGDHPDQKRFSPGLATNLASLIRTYRHWLD